ncbi:MAG: 3-dehydro-L-gulonate 2-dehydrogenase [Bacteroidota bacterium]
MLQESTAMVRISVNEMQDRFTDILIKEGFTHEKAVQCAAVFANNSLDGVSSHGINRFPRFIEYIRNRYINILAEPTLQNKLGNMEQWNGNLGPGILNAIHATKMAMKLANENGIGCVTLNNTNHWMRGGAYGWQAAKAGYIFIGWTNTIANMPAWGAKDARLGNNPLVIAMPYKDEAIVLDMAMSQYSFGAMELAVIQNKKLSVQGGFDTEGVLTDDPIAILETRRPLPVGYWKGAGLALLLDLLATVLSGGSSTYEISKKEIESGLSQIFIAFDTSKFGTSSAIAGMIENIINDYHQSVVTGSTKKIIYPGEKALETRKNNLEYGIPVMQKIWNEIMKL